MINIIFPVLSKFSMLSRYIRTFLIASGVLLFSISIYSPPDIFAADVKLTIIHSSNINGYLFPCPT